MHALGDDEKTPKLIDGVDRGTTILTTELLAMIQHSRNRSSALSLLPSPCFASWPSYQQISTPLLMKANLKGPFKRSKDHQTKQQSTTQIYLPRSQTKAFKQKRMAGRRFELLSFTFTLSDWSSLSRAQHERQLLYQLS